MLIPMNELNNMKPDYESKRTSLYFLRSGDVLIRFKHLNNQQKKMLLKKYEYIHDTNIKGIITPHDILETEKGFCGYVEKCVPYISTKRVGQFQDYVNDNRYKITLGEITEYFLSCSDIVEAGHEEEIINPDLSSEGNCYYDFRKKQATFVDFHDMQVRDLKSTGLSAFIAIDKNIFGKKYGNGNLWTPNIDYYTLAIRYLYYTTKLNFPRAARMRFPISELIDMANLNGTHFADILHILHDQDKPNESIKDAIIELNKNYKLSRFEPNMPRQFIKKR